MASRRPATRGTAAVNDENKITATRSTKNAGLALRGKSALAAGKAANTVKPAAAGKAGLADPAKKRTVLADSSNKVQQAQGNTTKLGGKLSLVVEEGASKKPISSRTLRSSVSKQDLVSVGEDQDGDAVMENAEASSRPVKSLRSSNNSKALATKSSNIPAARASTTSTKNAGLRQKPPLRRSASGLAKGTTAAQVQEEEALVNENNKRRTHPDESREIALHEEVEPPAQERRRSKRLRASDPEGPASLTAAGASVEDLDRSVAEKIARVIESDVGSELDMQDEEVEYAKDAGWEDLDIGDEEDPLMVAEYVVEIHDYMKELELTTMADPHYMSKQTEVTWKMRGILVDWLVEVHGKFRLLPETIFLATNILDRLMSVRTVSLQKFQLVGVVSLFIAAKYEEVVCPSVQSFLYMTDGGYTDEEMLSAERYILKQLDFNLSYPNPINFLRRISKADGYDIQSRTVAKYFLEMTCVERKFISAPPSLIAAAGMWLSRKILNKGVWNANLVHYSTYSQGELLPTAQLMLDYVLRKGQTGAAPGTHEHPHFYKKYTSKKFYKAAEIVREWAESRYLLKKGADKGSTVANGGAVSLFGSLENAGRLEEWEEEGGDDVPPVDYE